MGWGAVNDKSTVDGLVTIEGARVIRAGRELLRAWFTEFIDAIRTICFGGIYAME